MPGTYILAYVSVASVMKKKMFNNMLDQKSSEKDVRELVIGRKQFKS